MSQYVNNYLKTHSPLLLFFFFFLEFKCLCRSYIGGRYHWPIIGLGKMKAATLSHSEQEVICTEDVPIQEVRAI